MKTVLVFILTLFSVSISYSQPQWKHKPFRDFRQDTLAYLKQNFDSKFNGNYFKGKSVAELISHINPRFDRIETACNKYNALFRLDICYKKKTIPRSTNDDSKLVRYFTIAVYVEKVDCPSQFKEGIKVPITKQSNDILRTITLKDIICYENEVLMIKKE